jgi:chromosome segregation protein
MLKLKRVELQGFKSFYDRSEMRFHGAGIAAIVGPNGCGKSNLSDAISWVLGEQSAKSLRGSRMEDVIFAGTRDRKPLGMASVTMTLVDPEAHAERLAAEHAAKNGQTNGNGHHAANGVHPDSHSAAPVQNGTHKLSDGKLEEVTITRRLFRSGESEYLINGKTARLRDIQDLFLGSGLGPESYAIIEQGRIGQILSTKPQDRRAVIEEAAGITRFKTKKRLAEAKLEGAKQNLTRVFDILEEVSRQLNSLKRQAAKARRHDELKGEMITELKRSLAGRFRVVERDASATAVELQLATADYQQLQTQLTAQDEAQRTAQEQVFALEAELTEARRQMAERRVEAERVRGKLQNQASQVANIEQRLTQHAAEVQSLMQRLEELQADLASFAQRLIELDAQTEQARTALNQKGQERDALQNHLRERERAIEAARQQVLRLLGEASSLRNQLAHSDQYIAGLERDMARSQREAESAALDVERFEKAKNELGERMKARQMELQSIGDQRKQVEQDLAERRTKAVDSRRRLEELRAETSRLRARKDSLQDVLSHRAYTTESVKRLFKAVEGGKAPELKPAGVLADFVEVDRQYEKAAEEFLHEELEYVVVKDFAEAGRGIDLMRTDLDGRATFLVHPEAGATIQAARVAEPAIGPETGIIGRLSEMLKLTNGLTHAPSALLPRVARCYLVENRQAAQRLALQYPDIYFLLPDGVCYHGHAVSGGKKTGSGPLALKRELRDVSSQFNAKQTDFDRTKAALDDLEVGIHKLTEELERLRHQQQSQEKDAVGIQHEMRKVTDEFNRAQSRLSVARVEIQRLTQEIEKSRAKRLEIEKIVGEKEGGREEQERALTEARTALEGIQKESARVSEEHSALRVELASFEERRRSEQAAKARLENQAREMGNRQRNLQGEMERLGAEKSRLLADNEGLNGRSEVLATEIAEFEEKVQGLAARDQEMRAELSALEEAVKALRGETQGAGDRRSTAEVELVKRQAELKYLEETCRKELQISLQELAEVQSEELDDAALGEAEVRYQELKSKIEALGPVNPSALEEFEEAQQRYDFLNAQRTDLLDSIRDTEKAIQEIDTESRKRFTEAFEHINANFREMFKTLFGGGVGEMRLGDAENVNESGIDIVASPPGKKLQSVLLLSGGERALTAMALLMAIFKYQPSPFCVLDEVDAPLDEANIERLMRLLKEMSRQTQFVIITHSKRTMEAAQALYGVTMQEPGVSKLVSVKFHAPEPPAAPPPPPPVEQAALLAV